MKNLLSNNTLPGPVNNITVKLADVTNDKIIPVYKDEDFKPILLKELSAWKNKDCIFIIESYQHLIGEIELLKKLKKTNFKIKGFKGLSKKNIDILIKHHDLDKQVRSKKMVAAINRKRIMGEAIGNPNISNIAKEYAAKQRIWNAIYNDENIVAAKEIFKLHKQGESLNKIATHLNKEGIKSRRNGNFYAKSVDRIIKRYEELREGFIAEDKLVFDKIKSEPFTLVNYKQGQNFENEIKLIIKNIDLENGFSIKLLNNKKESILSLYENDFIINGKQLEIQFPLKKYSELIPGLYFINIAQSKQENIIGYFYIGKNIEEIMGIRVEDFNLK